MIHDLRVSITDRCNYKCVYCRTGEVGAQYPELAIDEYLRLIALFVSWASKGAAHRRRAAVAARPARAGRGTGEAAHAGRRATRPGADDQWPSAGHAGRALKAAGLNRVTVSMDAVDAADFERITRDPGSFAKVLAGIRAARAAGLTPLKINCVLLRGFNDDQIEGFAQFAREEDVVVRFIEFMPLEEGRLWTPEIVVPLKEIVDRIGRTLPLVPKCRRANPARQRGVTALPTAWARSALSLPSARLFAALAAGCVLRRMEKFAPACFRRWNTICMAACALAQEMTELRGYIVRTVLEKEARHHIGEPGIPQAFALDGAHRRMSIARLRIFVAVTSYMVT